MYILEIVNNYGINNYRNYLKNKSIISLLKIVYLKGGIVYEKIYSGFRNNPVNIALYWL